MLIGYARVSKADGSQSLDLQRDGDGQGATDPATTSGGLLDLMIRHTSARCLLLILLWPATGSAQTGSIRGSVVDQTDLVLPGATVTVRGNGVPRTASSDEQGTFELAGVAPGTYTLHVSLVGFSDATVEDVTVSGAPLALPPGRAAARELRRHGGRDRLAQRGPADRCAGVDVGHLDRHA